MIRSFFRFWLSLVSPSHRRDMVLGDLDEEWAERVQPRRGAVAARWWYIREAWSMILAFQRDRIRSVLARSPVPDPADARDGAGALGGSGGGGWLLDIRQTARGLLRSGTFTVVTILTLAVGMSGMVTMFALAHAAFLRPLAEPDADRLVRVFTGYENDREGRNAIAPLTWQDALERPDLLDAVEVWEVRSYHLRDQGTVRRVQTARVSSGLLSLMGATPMLGRLFLEDDAIPGQHRSVILSHGMWTRSFGGDSSVLGTSAVLDDTSYEIVGVLSPEVVHPPGVDLWVPLALGPEWYEPGRRGWEFLGAVARVRDGVTANDVAVGLTAQLAANAPGRVERVGQRVNAVELREHRVGDAGAVIVALTVAVGLVLLIGCANVMNLVLARAEVRRNEFALRRALGASGGRLVRLVALETLGLSLAGGALGVVTAVAITRLLAVAPIEALADLGAITVSWPVLGFALIVSAGVGLIFGLAPVVGALWARPGSVLRANTGRAGGSAGGNRLRAGLVVAEVALAVMLVFGVGITGDSFRRLTSVAPGFEAGNTLALSLETPLEGYGMRERGDVYRRVLERVRALPDVSRAALTYALPLTGVQWSASFDLVTPDPSLPDAALGGNMRPVSPDYFQTMGIPLLAGRGVTDADAAGAPNVVIVDQTLADRVWPGRSPLGERIDLGVFLGESREAEVVGLVGNVRDRGLSVPASGHVYFSAWQSPQRRMILVAQPSRVEADPAAAIRAAVADVEPGMPIYDVRAVTSVIAESVAPSRLSFLVLTGFAGAALLLAAIGVYGVLSYIVALRTREFGMRLALGATPGDVMSLILRQVAGLWLLGGVAGALGALAAGTAARSLVYEANAGNPLLLAAAVGGLGLVALVAGVIPARRASRVDCVEAIRES